MAPQRKTSGLAGGARCRQGGDVSIPYAARWLGAGFAWTLLAPGGMVGAAAPGPRTASHPSGGRLSPRPAALRVRGRGRLRGRAARRAQARVRCLAALLGGATESLPRRGGRSRGSGDPGRLRRARALGCGPWPERLRPGGLPDRPNDRRCGGRIVPRRAGLQSWWLPSSPLRGRWADGSSAAWSGRRIRRPAIARGGRAPGSCERTRGTARRGARGLADVRQESAGGPPGFLGRRGRRHRRGVGWLLGQRAGVRRRRLLDGCGRGRRRKRAHGGGFRCDAGGQRLHDDPGEGQRSRVLLLRAELVRADHERGDLP